jgi:putative tricarboxylic transport membrane protein
MDAPRRRVSGELVFVLFLLLFSLTALWQAWRIAGLSSWSSPGAVPMLAALIMVVTGVKIVFFTRRLEPSERTSGRSAASEFYHQMTPAAVIWFTLFIAGYMFALEPLGFVVCSFIFLVLAMYALGERRIMRTLAISAISLACVYVIFQTAFSVVLPEGILRGVLR